jgi:hypothetical protein
VQRQAVVATLQGMMCSKVTGHVQRDGCCSHGGTGSFDGPLVGAAPAKTHSSTALGPPADQLFEAHLMLPQLSPALPSAPARFNSHGARGAVGTHD